MITTNNKTKFSIHKSITIKILNFVTIKMFLRLNNFLKNGLFNLYINSKTKKSW